MSWFQQYSNRGSRAPEVEVPRLEPKDLYDRRMRRDYARLKSYNHLLEQIYHRIYSSSQLSGNTASILYTVPPFILGLPKLDMEDCIVYLVFQLRQAGFEVRFTWPNLLFISWRHTEGEYLTKKNPIIQAMTPEPPPPPPKPLATSQKKGKAAATTQSVANKPANFRPFNDDITMITSNIQPSSFGTTPVTATPRSAAEYRPPDSFIQQIERPGPDRQPQAKQQSPGNILTDLWNF